MKREMFLQKAALALLANHNISDDFINYPNLASSRIIKAATELTNAMESEFPGIFGKNKTKLHPKSETTKPLISEESTKKLKLKFSDIL